MNLLSCFHVLSGVQDSGCEFYKGFCLEIGQRKPCSEHKRSQKCMFARSDEWLGIKLNQFVPGVQVVGGTRRIVWNQRKRLHLLPVCTGVVNSVRPPNQQFQPTLHRISRILSCAQRSVWLMDQLPRCLETAIFPTTPRRWGCALILSASRP